MSVNQYQPFTFAKIPNYTVVFAFPTSVQGTITTCVFVGKRRVHGTTCTYRPGWAIIDDSDKSIVHDYYDRETFDPAEAFAACFARLAEVLET